MVVPAIDVDVHESSPPDGVHLHLDVRYLVLAPPDAVGAGQPRVLRFAGSTGPDLEQLGPPIDPSTRRLVHRGLGPATLG